jgi:hypothetical protein
MKILKKIIDQVYHRILGFTKVLDLTAHIVKMSFIFGCISMIYITSNFAQNVSVEIQQQIIEALDIYLTPPKFRDIDEQVRMSNHQIEIWMLDSLEQGLVDQKLCLGSRWLLKGRLKRSKGLQAIFEQNPSVNEVSLIFYRVKTRVNPDLSGAYQQKRSAVAVARLTMSRNRIYALNLESLDQQLKSDQCLPVVKRFLEDFWISDKVQMRRDRLRALRLKKMAGTVTKTTPVPQTKVKPEKPQKRVK